MLLICILVLCTTSLILAVVVSSLASRYERNEFLKKYDIALNNLQSAYELKYKNFHNTLSSLFDSASGYNNVCSFLKTENQYELDDGIKRNVIEILSDICDRDSKCVGILLYSNNTKQLYQFDTKYLSIKTLRLEDDFPKHIPFVLDVLSDSTLSSSSLDFSKPSSHIYGMVGTIYEHSGKVNDVLGQIIILYPTSELLESINDRYLDKESLFSITNSDGNVIFRSLGDYSSSKDLIQNYLNIKTLNNIALPTELKKLNNKVYYTSSIYNGRYDYYVTYQIAKSGNRTGYTQNLIIVFALFTCFCAIGLYILTYYLTEKKVRIIQKGMSKIGSINLSYRIPPTKGQDEFTQIINGFNRMCDELKKNVEQSYVYELQQKQAELYALQTSINPHFLYNTLELIRVQTLQGDKNAASQMILLLSKIYRSQTKRDMYVSLEEELEQCENLMILYQYRFRNFEYDFNIPTSLYSYGLPKNTLQPLLENYFIHGLDQTKDDNYLELSGELIETDGKSMIQLTLSDNGQSIKPDELEVLKIKLKRLVFNEKETNGFALSNVNSRLRIVFGEGYGITPDIGDDGVGFKITILIPLVSPIEMNEKQREN